MSNVSNSSVPSQAEELFASFQAAVAQTVDNEQQENNRSTKQEQHRYNETRALTHARSVKEAEKEAIKKSTKAGRTRRTAINTSDSLKAAGEELGNSMTSAKAADKTKKPQMPAPTSPFGSGDATDEDDNVMALIARVLVMVANVQIKGWKNFWKMGSQNINTSFEMSQAEAQNTRDQYAQQAAATNCQAEQYGKDGGMQLANFGMCVVMGGMGPEDEALKNQPETDDLDLTNPTVRGTNPEGEAPVAADPEDAAANPDAPANPEGDAPAERQSWTDWATNGLKKGWKGFGTATEKVNRGIQKVMGNGFKYAQVITPGMTGTQNLVYDQPLTAQKGSHEGMMGQFAAAATLARGYAEYNNQIFNRQEDIRQQTTQGVDYAMNVYKSASDAMTQAVSSMSR